jgi:3-deoxy-D-arabino-heptulosonate 7-phosphate (DAHP) synthase
VDPAFFESLGGVRNASASPSPTNWVSRRHTPSENSVVEVTASGSAGRNWLIADRAQSNPATRFSDRRGLVERGIRQLRGGAFKPALTLCLSGAGEEALTLLNEVRDRLDWVS